MRNKAMRLIYRTPRAEYWVQWDGQAGVWEMFASPEGDDYLGAFDTPAQARAYAVKHVKGG